MRFASFFTGSLGLLLSALSPTQADPSDRDQDPGAAERARASAPPSIRDIVSRPIDPADVGIMRREVEVDVPDGMKLTRVIRVYREGEFDPRRSSGQVSATSFRPDRRRVSLGLFDPDVLSPRPSADLKVLGDAGDFWVTVPRKADCVRVIGGLTPKVVEAGKEYPVLDLAVGPHVSPPRSSVGGEVDLKRAWIRVTVGIRLDPLTAEEARDLERDGGLAKAFPLDR